MFAPDADNTTQQPDNDPILDWDALYWELMPRIYNFFRYRLGNDQVAEDCTSVTFTKAWRAREQYQHDLGVFEAWLFTIARNVATDYLRKSQRRKEVSLDMIWGISSEQSVEGEATKRHEFERLYELVKTLPTREQDIIAMKYGAEMTNRAIAAALNLSESNVGTIVHRIVHKLRKHWEVTHEQS